MEEGDKEIKCDISVSKKRWCLGFQKSTAVSHLNDVRCKTDGLVLTQTRTARAFVRFQRIPYFCEQP